MPRRASRMGSSRCGSTFAHPTRRADPTMAVPSADPSLLQAALDAIDAANADDPTLVMVDGVCRPKEIFHAERMTHWLGVLDPDADAAQQLAARAHHLRR